MRQNCIVSHAEKNIINENIVGLQSINQMIPTKKESFETAFETFLKEAKKKEKEQQQAGPAQTRQQSQEAIKTVLREEMQKFTDTLNGSKMTAKSGMAKFLKVHNYDQLIAELERNGLTTEAKAVKKVVDERTAKLT